jgi:hypothetical protein
MSRQSNNASGGGQQVRRPQPLADDPAASPEISLYISANFGQTVPVMDLGGLPDPAKATDIAEFSALLAELVAQAGAPAHRELARQVGPMLKPPQQVSKSTISELLRPGRRRLNLDLVVAILRVLGLSEAVVDRWRQACIRLHGAAKYGGPAGVFRQLPADLATFTGRERELARLLHAATQPSAVGPSTVVISAIEGMAGIGKTQLAIHAAHELVRACAASTPTSRRSRPPPCSTRSCGNSVFPGSRFLTGWTPARRCSATESTAKTR